MKTKTLTVASALLATIAFAPMTMAQQGDPAQAGQMQAGQSEWKGLGVYGSDGQMIGEVADVRKGSGDQPEAIHVKTGSDLGLGERTVEIKKDKFSKSGSRIELQMTADEVKSLPSASGSAQ